MAMKERGKFMRGVAPVSQEEELFVRKPPQQHGEKPSGQVQAGLMSASFLVVDLLGQIQSCQDGQLPRASGPGKSD